MSERLFEAFREDAVSIIERPDFEELAHRGRQRRLRRYAAVGAAASALVVTGLLALPGGMTRSEQPTGPVTPSVTPYPGATMHTLAEGTYELSPFADPGAPVVRVTVPPLWNAWEGPNRFEGIRAERNNSEALTRTDFVVGMLALDVEEVASPECGQTDVSGGDAAALVQALRAVPRLKMIGEPDRTHRFGHVATHLFFEDTGMTPACSNGLLFDTATNGQIYFVPGQDNVYNAWVIETDAGPLLIWYGWTKAPPMREIDALLTMVDTLEVVDPS